MTTRFLDVDVRPILRAGGEPFAAIMQALDVLEPNQGLRLRATFEPVPLFGVMKSRGFTHEANELDRGEWEVLFCPAEGGGEPEALGPTPVAAEDVWPVPVKHLDNRELDPPEPMVRILAAIETMKAGEVVSALLCREPVFLLPQPARRGHQWRSNFGADGSTYKVLVRVNAAGVTK